MPEVFGSSFAECVVADGRRRFEGIHDVVFAQVFEIGDDVVSPNAGIEVGL